MLILSTLLSLTIICNATLIEDQIIDIPAEEEIMPIASDECSTEYSKKRFYSIEEACDLYIGRGCWDYDPATNTWNGSNRTIYAASPHSFYNYYYEYDNGSRFYFPVHDQAFYDFYDNG